MSSRILLVRLGSMGDVVHTLPVLSALRAAFPDARIDWLIEQRWQELVELHPGLSNVVPVDTHAWRREPLSRRTRRGLGHTLGGLWQGGYDLALDLQGLYKSAVFSLLSGAPRRVGFDVYSLREPGASMFYTQQVMTSGTGGRALHVVEKNLALAAQVGATAPEVRFDLPTTLEDDVYVEEQLRAQGGKDFFVINPGGGWGAKRWPLERYAELARWVAAERGWRCYLNAGPGEESLVAEIERREPSLSPLRFPLTLRQLVALLRRARLLVAGDTGPLHIAAAVGTPLVALFGPTDPLRNGPCVTGASRARVVHHPELQIRSYRRKGTVSPAMLALTVAEVKAAVEEVLGASGE